LSTGIGMVITVRMLGAHELRTEPGWVDLAVVALSVTNLDLLQLLTWDITSYNGLPDQSMNTLPTITVVAEDLPQLFIQAIYLIMSGDTNNIVVLVSVSISGCSLLLRFARGAMHFATRIAPEGGVVNTSKIKDWDHDKLTKWLVQTPRKGYLPSGRKYTLTEDTANYFADLPDLTSRKVLELAQAIYEAEEEFEEEEEEDAVEDAAQKFRQNLLGF